MYLFMSPKIGITIDKRLVEALCYRLYTNFALQKTNYPYSLRKFAAETNKHENHIP